MKKITAYDVVVTALLVIIALCCLFPILNTLAISFSDKTSAALGKVSLLPVNFSLVAYEELAKVNQFFISFWNSVKRTVLGTAINLFFIISMAYPLSRTTKEFRLRNVYMWIIVFTMLFNGGIVPNFLLVKRLGLMNSIWALVLPGAVPVFSVIMLMNFFKGIPHSLEEAAFMDGASPLFVLVRIFIPLAKPAIATVTLFAIVHHWNAFFDGQIYINNPEKQPLQTYIRSLTVNMTDRIAYMSVEEMERLDKLSSINFNSAKVIVSMVPVLIIYPFIQRYFEKGIVMGAVKE